MGKHTAKIPFTCFHETVTCEGRIVKYNETIYLNMILLGYIEMSTMRRPTEIEITCQYMKPSCKIISQTHTLNWISILFPSFSAFRAVSVWNKHETPDMSRGRGRGRGRGPAGLDAALPEDVKASWHGSWTIWKMADGNPTAFFPPYGTGNLRVPRSPKCHVSTQEIRPY